MARAKAKTNNEHGYEFGGPIVVGFFSLALPIFCYVLSFSVNDVSGSPPPSLLHPSTFTLAKLKQEVGWPGLSGLLNTESVVWTLAYYALNIALWKMLPGEDAEGTTLRSGGKLKYRFNAFYSAVFVGSILVAGTLVQGPDFPVWTFINNNYIQLLTTNILISYALASYVYVASFSVQQPKDPRNRELAAHGSTGNMVYDWFIGRELNPRVEIPLVGEFDIKTFMEVRPGMLGWIILDFAFLMRQWRTFGYVTNSMLITTLTQALYMFDAIYLESLILTQMDITTDGFGFMLSFGDLAWLPFTYSIQARYLSIHPIQLGWSGVSLIMLVLAVGYYIFRVSNLEKSKIRTDPMHPRVKNLTYIETSKGTKLLTSGWWGRARHVNYLGDWIMSWAYCLPCAFSGYVIETSAITGQKVVSQGANNEAAGWAIPITYFYMLYFAILLVHRERRDESKCRRKYGKDWEDYCKQVPWRIVPYVY